MSGARELEAILHLLAEISRPRLERDRRAMLAAVSVLAPKRPGRDYDSEVRAHLDQHPDASPREVAREIRARYQHVLAVMRDQAPVPAQGEPPASGVQPSRDGLPGRAARELRDREKAA